MYLIDMSREEENNMLKTFLKKDFEQTSHHVLPRKASRIIAALVNDIAYKTSRNPAAYSRELDLAHARLHMRLHQQFSHKSREFLPTAHDLLRELSEERCRPSLSAPARS